MKRAIKIIMVTGIFLLLTMVGFSQSPPHPNGGNGPGSGNTPVGGGSTYRGWIDIDVDDGCRLWNHKGISAK